MDKNLLNLFYQKKNFNSLKPNSFKSTNKSNNISTHLLRKLTKLLTKKLNNLIKHSNLLNPKSINYFQVELLLYKKNKEQLLTNSQDLINLLNKLTLSEIKHY